MGLRVEVASEKRQFGKYYGPGTGLMQYYGRVPGTLDIRFTDEVVLRVQNLQVIDHREPALILGADVLHASKDPWSFRSLGVDREGRGFIEFESDQGKRVEVALLSAPDTSEFHKTVVKEPLPTLSTSNQPQAPATRFPAPTSTRHSRPSAPKPAPA